MRRKSIRRKTIRLPKQIHIIPEIELDLSDDTRREIFVIIFGALAILSILAIGANLGIVGDYTRKFLFITFGWGTFLLPIVFISMALARAFSKKLRFTAARNLGIVSIVWPLLSLVHLFTPFANGEALNVAVAGQYGGYLGFILSTFLRRFLGDLGAGVVLIALILIGIPMVFSKSFLYFIQSIFNANDAKEEIAIEVRDSNKKSQSDSNNKNHERDNQVNQIKKYESATHEKTLFEIKHGDDPISSKRKKGDIITPIFDPKLDQEWHMPPLDLLRENQDKIAFDDMALRQSADKIREKLSNFGINVEMREAHIGPTVIQYTLKPDDDVKLSKIRGLQDDLALALAAKSIRIEAPIPGKSLVGIELPADKRTDVMVREVLQSDAFTEIKSNLRLVLGRDVTGRPMVANLKKMPHLLIAGQTGSGKSVSINVMLISLLYQNSPNDLKLILIDPKRVELSMYDGIPHLLTPVIAEPEKVVHALKWAVAEMTRRLRILEEDHVRNLEEYNGKHWDARMPNIVIIIDELADLMIVAGKEVEALICRLAQIARAAGIHLMVATQRPSVNVITGLIKANIPSRIAFTVQSGIDSRTVIDQYGAEKLLGHGDALFFPSGAPAPMRIQSAFISTKEVERIVNYLKLAGPAEYQAEIFTEEHEINVPGMPERSVFDDAGSDPILDEAIIIIRETGKASASLLQRRLSIGYARAARLLDIMEKQGLIGPASGAKARKIFL
ncbi:MAG: DNA translocase FtsK 4TM domain-containing protein [Patescibacteria group bacterium]|nr:DNA translocase FtsK 4TM domain-containing protein [Patescibacteria group bacterium]